MLCALFIFLNIILVQFSFSADGCDYILDAYTTVTTGGNYLTSSNSDENKQKCFSLSNSEAQRSKCCYKKIGDKEICTSDTSGEGVECPTQSTIKNNCGMALIYEPTTKEICTEISLVNGYCCFVKTKSKGNACLKQDEIDEDEKNEITDYMRDYFRNRLNLNPDEEI